MRWWSRFTKLGSGTESGLYSVSRIMGIIAAIGMAIMVLLTVADVTGRYVFNSPIKGTWEFVGLMLVVGGTWGLGQCQIKKGHIKVTVFLERYSPRVKLIFNSIAYLIGIGGFSLLCWQMFRMAHKFYLLGSSGVTDTLRLPFAPFMLLLSISTGVMVLVLLADLEPNRPRHRCPRKRSS